MRNASGQININWFDIKGGKQYERSVCGLGKVIPRYVDDRNMKVLYIIIIFERRFRYVSERDRVRVLPAASALPSAAHSVLSVGEYGR